MFDSKIGFSMSKSSVIRHFTTSLVVESMEDRCLLAGNVTATFVGGNLVLRGDAEANSITVSQTDPNTVSILGKTDAGSATTINGLAGPVIFTGNLQSIDADFFGGNDQFLVGNDSTEVNALNKEILFGTAGTYSGAAAARTVVSKGITVRGGDGIDVVSIFADVGGDINVDLGAQNDGVGIQGSVVKGSVTFNAGTGDSPSLLVRNTTVGKQITINGSTGDNRAVISDSSGMGVSINTKDGSDRVFIQSSNIKQNVNIKTLGKTDSIAGFGLQIGGSLNIDSGAGDDFLTVDVDGAKFNNISGAFTANLGTGVDNIDLGINTNKNVTINASDAGDTIDLSSGSQIGGSVLVNVASKAVPGTSSVSIGNGFGAREGVVSIADDLVIKNGNHNINLTLGLANQPLNVGRNLTVVSGSDSITGSVYNLTNLVAGKAVSVTGGNGIDRLASGILNSGTSMNFNMGNGGNGTGDSFQTLFVGTNLVMNYGSGNDIIGFTYTDVGGSATINAGAGLDIINTNTQFFVSTNFVYSGGDGGNGGINNPDVINLTNIKGNASILSAGGEDAFNITGSVLGNLTVSTGGGKDSLNLSLLIILGNLSINSGLGDDAITATVLQVSGTSQFLTGGGSDSFTMTGNSFYLQQVSINLAGTGTDNDSLTIAPSIQGESILMLKGLSIISGSGLDSLNGGTGDGLLIVHNGVNAPKSLNYGVNFLTL